MHQELRVSINQETLGSLLAFRLDHDHPGHRSLAAPWRQCSLFSVVYKICAVTYTMYFNIRYTFDLKSRPAYYTQIFIMQTVYALCLCVFVLL